jgi:hypothetical protein
MPQERATEAKNQQGRHPGTSRDRYGKLRGLG